MKRALYALSIAFLSVLATACSSSSPTDPSAVPSAPHGATVQGTVNPTVGAAGNKIRALSGAPGIKVSVMGTGLSTTTDGKGQFVLTGVPTGSITLRFEGPGMDATLTLSGLLDGQTLTITVRVSGNQATEEPEPPEPSPSPKPSPSPEPDEVDFEGTIDSISLPTLVVSGKTILTDAQTQVDSSGGEGGDSAKTKLTLADLKVGQKVSGEGILQADGSILARKIHVQLEKATFQGTIDSISLPTLVVSGKTILTDAQTQVDSSGGEGGDSAKMKLTLADLKVGQKVSGDGILQADGSILARKIHVQIEKADFSGTIDSISLPTLVVSGKTILTDSQTQVSSSEGGDSATGHLTLADLKVGQKVKGTGLLQADGSILAREIQVQSGGQQGGDGRHTSSH